MFCVCRGPGLPAGRPGRHGAAGRPRQGQIIRRVRNRGPGRQGAGDGPAGRGLWRSRQRLRLQGQSRRHRRRQAGDHRDRGRARLLHRGKRQGKRQGRCCQCAALLDDPAGPHLLRLCRGSGARKRLQDLYRRRRAPDVCHRRDPQRGPGRRATLPDAVQHGRAQQFQEYPHAGAGGGAHSGRRRRKDRL